MSAYRHHKILVGDIRTHYLEAGDGPPLVLLHGGEYGASAETTWRFSIEALAKNFQVIAPDMLGYGLTDKIYSFSDPAGFRIRHLKGFLETIGVSKARLAGNSAGGGILLRAAAMAPPSLQIEKMVTICGNAGLFKTESQALLENYELNLEDMKRITGLLFHDPEWVEKVARERYEVSLIPGSWESLCAARLRRPGYQSNASAEEFIERLSLLKIPTLIMSCRHDRLNQKDWDIKLQKIIPGSKIHSFQRSAHEPQIEEAEEFSRVVTEFLLDP